MLCHFHGLVAFLVCSASTIILSVGEVVVCFYFKTYVDISSTSGSKSMEAHRCQSKKIKITEIKKNK